jgi:hypothetical protein
MGKVYFRIGILEKCFKNWVKFNNNINNSFNPSIKKILKVRNFLLDYFPICNSILRFKYNLHCFRHYQEQEIEIKLNKSYSSYEKNSDIISVNKSSNEYMEFLSKNEKFVNNKEKNFEKSVFDNFKFPNIENYKSDLSDFFADYETLFKYEPNLKENYVEYYEFFRGLIHMFINSKSKINIYLI